MRVIRKSQILLGIPYFWKNQRARNLLLLYDKGPQEVARWRDFAISLAWWRDCKKYWAWWCDRFIAGGRCNCEKRWAWRGDQGKMRVNKSTLVQQHGQKSYDWRYESTVFENTILKSPGKAWWWDKSLTWWLPRDRVIARKFGRDGMMSTPPPWRGLMRCYINSYIKLIQEPLPVRIRGGAVGGVDILVVIIIRIWTTCIFSKTIFMHTRRIALNIVDPNA